MRPQEAASPLPQTERENVEAFVWEVVTAERVGSNEGIDRHADGTKVRLRESVDLFFWRHEACFSSSSFTITSMIQA